MLYYSGYPDDAVEPAKAYLLRRSADAVAGTTADWDHLKPSQVLDELAAVETGWELRGWTVKYLAPGQARKLQAAIRQARSRSKRKRDQVEPPVSVSLTRAAADALIARAEREGLSRSAALLEALAAPLPDVVIDPEEERIEDLVADARRKLMAGKSYRAIADAWNLRRVPTRTGKGTWHHAGVKRLVNNAMA